MDIQLFLVPYDTARRGWRSGAGPEHLLNAGLTNHLHSQGHFVADIQVIEDDPTQPPTEIRTAFELARRLASAVREARAGGRFPLVLSGNCNSAVGTLSGLTPARRAIFWFDAHGDCNTPDTTTTGFLDVPVSRRPWGWAGINSQPSCPDSALSQPTPHFCWELVTSILRRWHSLPGRRLPRCRFR